MSYKLLTNLLFEPRGKHNPSLTYNIKDTVMSEDGSKVYFALDNVPAGIPLTDTNYWMLQMDLSASKNAMDVAAANARTQTDATIASANTRVEDMMGKAADAVTSVADYAAKVGMRVKGETKITKGNPMTIYPDGGSLLKVQTDIPIKQLGEGDPYPAGSGKNLCPPLSGVKTESGVTFTPNADGSVTVSGTATAQSAVGTQQFVLKAGTYTVSGAPVGSAIASYDIYVFKADGTGTIARSYDGINGTFIISNDTNVALAMRVPTGAVDTSKVFWPMIEAGSTATAFMPYSNIRPFVGYDELGLNVAGKNLLPFPYEDGGVGTVKTMNGGTFTVNADGSITVNGTPTDSSYIRLATMKLLGAKDLTSTETTPATNGTYVLSKMVRYNKNKSVVSINLAKGKTYDNVTYYPQVELGTIATEYVPYQGSIHTVQLDKTTYQGHYDWLTGKFRAEWKGMRLLSSYVSTSMKYVPGYVGAWMDKVLVDDHSEGQETILCSHLLGRNVYNWNRDGVYVQGGNTIGIQFSGSSIPGYTDTGNADQNAGLVRAYLDANDVQIVYKLANPIEIQLAPNVITAVEDGGVNHIYGDADLTVEWVKPLETSLTEHSNAKVDANNEALLMDVAKKERSVGNPIVINDAVANVAFPHVETVFMPKQSGSGDPYPAGSGKNLLPAGTVQTINDVTFTPNADGSIAVKGTAKGNVFYSANGLWNALNVKGGTEYILSGTPATAPKGVYLAIVGGVMCKQGVEVAFSYVENTTIQVVIVVESGNTVDYVFYPMIRLASNTDATYAPYSNIRPISGWDALEMNHTGKNLFTGWIRGGKINSIMGAFEITSDAARTGYIPVVPSKQIEISGLTDTLYNFVAFYDEAKNFVSRSNAAGLNAVTIRTPDNCAYIAITQYENVNVTGTITDLKDTVQIEYGTSVTEYTPHAGMDTYTVQIGQTVYGGKMDWLTGKLVAEWINITFVGGEVASTDSEGSGIFTTNAFATAFEAYCDNCCSHYASTRDYETFMTKDMSIAIWGSGQIRIHDSRFKSIAEINSYYKSEKAAGTPVQVAYKFATPIEIQLDPTRITTIPGTNTIFGDGEFTIDWFKSYKKVAEERENLLLDSFTDKAELSGNPIVMTPVGGLPFDSVVTEFSPKQSGSGDPYPYLGGKNIFPPWHEDSFEMSGVTFTKQADGSIRARGTPTAHAYITLTDYKTLRAHGFSEGPYTIHGLPAESDAWFVDLIGDANTQNINFYQNGVVNLTEEVNKNGTYAWRIVITPNMGAVDLVFKIQIEAGSTATEYAPPENIRPITGWDELNLGVAGKNLFNLNQTYDYFIDSIITGDVITTTFSSNGALHIKEGDVHPAGAYTLTIVPVSGLERFAAWLYYADNDEEKAIFRFNSTNLSAAFIADRPFKIGFSGIYGNPEHTCSYKVQLELASAATNFVPYQGNTLHTVQIGQTVYGGKFDWLTGKLVAEWACVGFDGSDISWEANNGGTDTLFYLITHGHNSIPAAEIGGRCICTHAPTKDAPPVDQIGCCVSATSSLGIIYLNLGVQTGAYGFNQYVAENGVQIAYELATPIEIQLTPTEIIALTGVNTLYGDGDTITAKFRQSKDVDILKRLSALETLMTNQTKGE